MRVMRVINRETLHLHTRVQILLKVEKRAFACLRRVLTLSTRTRQWLWIEDVTSPTEVAVDAFVTLFVSKPYILTLRNIWIYYGNSYESQIQLNLENQHVVRN